MTDRQKYRLNWLEDEISHLEQAHSRIEKRIGDTTAPVSPAMKQVYQSICKRQEARLIKIREFRSKFIRQLW